MDHASSEERPTEQTTREDNQSPVVTHRKAERMRTYTYRPRPEARM